MWELEQVKAEAGREGGQARTIAVLPFVDQSREKDQDYLCDGLAEDILIALGKVKGLRVASRAASFRFRSPDADVRETGRRLGVEAIVHGSVRKAGSRLRLAVELVDVADGFEIWAEVYERGVEDVFDVQGEITRAIARALEVDLSEGERASARHAGRGGRPGLGLLPAGAEVLLPVQQEGRCASRGSSSSGRSRSTRPTPGPGAGISDCAAFLYTNAGRAPEDLEQADGDEPAGARAGPGPGRGARLPRA